MVEIGGTLVIRYASSNPTVQYRRTQSRMQTDKDARP